MANKKILYTDSTGIIKELPSGSGVTASYYDDAGNGILFAKNITFNTMSFKNDGLLVVNNGTASVLTWSNGETVKNYDVISWDGTPNNRWKYINGTLIDVSGTTPGMSNYFTASSYSDLTDNFGEPKPKSLSNVITGVLSIQNGGTGLGFESSRNDFSGLTGEYILTGSLTGKFGFLTASQATSAVALVSNGTFWEYITQSLNNSVEVALYNQPGVYNWQKPAGTKQIRVLIQGGGGGGGSGANRANNTLAAIGGTGGGAGGFAQTPLFAVSDDYTNIQVTVGAGGIGGDYASSNNAGNSGSAGGSSSFGDFYVYGGLGGNGGNLSNTLDLPKQESSSVNYLIFSDVYNKGPQTFNNSNGFIASTTYGLSADSNKILNQETTRAGNGAGGGSLSASVNNVYDGGNGSINNVDLLSTFSSNSVVNSTNSTLVTSSGASFVLSSPFDDGGYSVNLSNNNATGYRLEPSNNIISIGINDDFTIETWYYNYNTTIQGGSYAGIFLLGTGPILRVGVYDSTDARANQFIVYANNDTVAYSSSAGDVNIANQWNHIAFVRKDSMYSLYFNGKKITLKNSSGVDLSTLSLPRALTLNSSAFSIGSTLSTIAFGAYVSEVRLCKKALYQSNFSIPITKFNYNTSIINSGSTAQPNASMAISSSVRNNLYLNEQNFSSLIKDIFLSTGGGGGASVIGTSGGGTGGDGSWGSGGGGGGASDASLATGRQGGNGGDGYVAVISYKY